MTRENLDTRLEALENRIGTDDVETLNDRTREHIAAVADPAEARRRLDAEERKRFDLLEEQIAEEGAIDDSGQLTPVGKRYFDFLLRGYPQT